MIWYKAWREARTRIFWSLMMLIAAAVMHPALFGALQTHPPKQNNLGIWFPVHLAPKLSGATLASSASWQIYLQAASIWALTIALLMAGSGLNTQTMYGMRQGVHPSMIYTLSLPVRRRSWLIVRSGVGLGSTAIMTLFLLMIPSLMRPFTGGVFPWSEALSLLPYFCLGALVFYSLSVLLSTFLDEVWQGMLSLAALGFLSGGVLSGGADFANIYRFMCTAGPIPWTGVMACLFISAGFMGLSAWIIEQKEF